MKFDDLKLKTKLLLPISGMAAAIAGMAAFGAVELNSISSRSRDLIANHIPAIVAMEQANYEMQSAGYDFYRSLSYANGTPESDFVVKDFKETVTRPAKYLEEAIGYYPDAATQIKDVKTKINNLFNDLAPQFNMATATNGISLGSKDAADDLDAMAAVAKKQVELDKTLDDLSNQITAITEGIRQQSNIDSDAMSADARFSLWLLIATGIAATIAGVAGALWMVSKNVALPIRNLQTNMQRLAGGDLESEVFGIARKDEIGEMARAVEVFKQAGIEKIRLESEAADERRRNALASKDVSEQQAAVMESLALGLAHLSSGDLTFRLNDRFPESYEKLRNDFNTAISTLESSLATVVENAAAIRGGATEISQAAIDLSKRTEQQAASLEETAASLNQITQLVMKSADGAKSAQSVVTRTREQARGSSTIVQETVEAMRRIETSSAQVGQIVGLIDEIAFQTNLLALNAGVEAARAGDAGRGFAVVAQEVRSLAQRSATAAKEIKTLVESSKSEIAAGVDLVGRTGHALSDIATQINAIDAVVSEISASAVEQSGSLGAVNTAVTDMDRTTQQNAAMVEESTAASQSLANEAGKLDQLMSLFTVSKAGRKAKQNTSPAASPVHAAQAKLTTAFSGARAKAVGDDWSEF